MRILIAHNDYGKPSGEEHALSSIVGMLEENGHSVFRMHRSSADIGNSLVSKCEAFFAGIHNPFAARAISRLLLNDKPDLLLVQNLYPFLSPSILKPAKEKRIPIIMRCPNYRLFCPNGLHLSHGQLCERCLGGREYWCVLKNCEGDLVKSLGYALRNAAARITRRILDNVTLFVVLSEFQRQRFIDAGIESERIEILPNVVPMLPNEVSPADPGKLITFVGRASLEKGIAEFLETARRLPQLPFAVAGSAERVPDLVKKSPSNVQWLGFLEEPKLNDLCAQSRLFVLPFRWFEGFPNVVTRAMMLGRPVIASRIGMLPEIVAEGVTGLLCDVGNVDELVAKTESLYADTERCVAMGQAAKTSARGKYGRETVAARLEEICNKALTIQARIHELQTGSFAFKAST